MWLCQRGRAGFALTDEGREVLRSSEAVLAAIEGFRSEVNQLHSQLRGDLNIGVMNNLVTQPKMRITRALKSLRGQGDGVTPLCRRLGREGFDETPCATAPVLRCATGGGHLEKPSSEPDSRPLPRSHSANALIFPLPRAVVRPLR